MGTRCKVVLLWTVDANGAPMGKWCKDTPMDKVRLWHRGAEWCKVVLLWAIGDKGAPMGKRCKDAPMNSRGMGLIAYF